MKQLIHSLNFRCADFLLNHMKRFVRLYIVLLLQASCNNSQQNAMHEKINIQDGSAQLQVSVIADLPDSMQPKTILLEDMPKPKKVVVPSSTGGFYTINNRRGKETRINLEPPTIKSMPLLQNEKGEIILGKNGMPFILGEGGKSNFTNFSSENGLALDAVRCSLMDESGNIWFGTLGGVSCYDGKTFTNYSIAQGLAGSTVFSLFEDSYKNLWFGTADGVSKYDGKSFVNITTDDGLAGNAVFSIMEDLKGNIWFSTVGGGVSRYDGNRIDAINLGEKIPLSEQGDLKKDKNGEFVKTFTNFTTDQGLANNNVYSSILDKKGNLWFATNGGGVSCFNGASFTNFNSTNGLAGNSVYCITEDKNGNIWFGTYDGGVSRFDGKSFVNFTKANGLASNYVHYILEDKTGNIWFATEDGITRYDGNLFTSFTSDQGLANNIVNWILEDKNGNLWFCTFGGGISRYDGKSFTNFTTYHGLANTIVNSILEDKRGNYWFATYGGGVSRYDGKSFTNYTIAQGMAYNYVHSILEDKSGNIWFGTEVGGVSCFDGKSFTTYKTTQGLLNNFVYSIMEDKNGILWFGTDGGVNRFDGKSFTSYTTDQGLVNNAVSDLMEDKKGNIWIGTMKGVSCFTGKVFINFTKPLELVNNYIYRIFEDKSGNIWFGTPIGLIVIREKYLNKLTEETILNKDGEMKMVTVKNNSKDQFIETYTTEDGLPDISVTQIIQMPNGKIAVGTNRGIALFNVSEDFSKLNDLEIYNTNTGYPVKDVNLGQNCMYLDSKGIIWAGTGSEKTALLRFDYSALNRVLDPPNLIIQSVKVRDENICWYDLQKKGVSINHEDSATALLQEFLAYGKTISPHQKNSLLSRFGNIQFDGISKFYPIPNNLVLPFEHNHISFEFAAIETSKPQLVQYQYILEGYDKNWSSITQRSNASFGNIREGTYTFKLKARGADGVWSKPLTYTFKVLPPWHRTWWAYLIYTFLFLAGLRIYNRWRVRKLRFEKEKLERTVEQRTQELTSEKKKSDDLLLNILPEEVAKELKSNGSAEAKQFDDVTVLFTDFKDFTQLSEKMTPKELVEEIHICFMTFDNIMEKFGLEKIKTIGDSYMCAGGLPVANKTHASDVVGAGLEIQHFIAQRVNERTALGKEPFQIRIGIHTGPVVAGIVGIKKFAYDIWGDTVNTASRMESSGEVGKVNISKSTYDLVKDKFNCVYRGKIQAKNKGEFDMYFVEAN